MLGSAKYSVITMFVSLCLATHGYDTQSVVSNRSSSTNPATERSTLEAATSCRRAPFFVVVSVPHLVAQP
jgi:hypothetical protein